MNKKNAIELFKINLAINHQNSKKRRKRIKNKNSQILNVQYCVKDFQEEKKLIYYVNKIPQ